MYKKTAIIFTGLNSPYVKGTEDFLGFQDLAHVYDKTKKEIGLFYWMLMTNKSLKHIKRAKDEEKILHRKYNWVLDKLSIPKTDRTLQDYVLSRIYLMQLTTFVANHAAFTSLTDRVEDLEFTYVTGHSFGIYNAIVASEATSFEESLHLVNKAAELNRDAPENLRGGLVAVRSKKEYDVSSVLEAFGDRASVAIHDNPRLKVIGALDPVLEQVIKAFRNDTALKQADGSVRRIDGITIPFHTHHMREIADEVKNMLTDGDDKDGMGGLRESEHRLLAPTSGEVLVDPDQILREAVDSIYKPLSWDHTIRMATIRFNVSRYIVIGLDEKKSMEKTIRFIHPDEDEVEILIVKDQESLDQVVEQLSNGRENGKLDRNPGMGF